MNAGDGAPAVLGGYVLEDELGSGASSVVYAATHARLGRRAAVKVLVLPPRGPWRERFLRESQIALTSDGLWAVVHDGALASKGMPRFDNLTREQVNALYAFIRASARQSIAAGGKPDEITATVR